MRRLQLFLLSLGLVGLFGMSITGCSVLKEPEAYGAIAADTATTAAALARTGFVETNPLGWAVVPLSIGAVEYAQTLSPEKGVVLVDAIGSVKWGAATNNLLLLLGATTPIAMAAGVGVFWWRWSAGSQEREYAAWCAGWIAETPGNTCLPYKAPA